MKIWRMSKGSYFFQVVNETIGENVLLGVLGCVLPRPVRRNLVSGAYQFNYALSVTRSLRLSSCGAQNYLCECNLKDPPGRSLREKRAFPTPIGRRLKFTRRRRIFCRRLQ